MATVVATPETVVALKTTGGLGKLERASTVFVGALLPNFKIVVAMPSKPVTLLYWLSTPLPLVTTQKICCPAAGLLF